MSLRQTSASVSLHEIFPQNHFSTGRDLRFSSCTSDPRRCRRGGLYVALQTPEFDGHDYATQAVRRGAVAVVAERRLPIDAPVLVVPDSREAFGWISHHLKDLPCRCLRTIGVTGTNGKTTTSLLIQSVLKAAGLQTGTLNDWSLTTGRAAKRWARPFRRRRCWPSRWPGCERPDARTPCSRRPAKCWPTRHGGPGVGCRRSHERAARSLDFHGSIINYRRAKARLFEHLKPGGFHRGQRRRSRDPVPAARVTQPVLTVGMRMPAELTATLIERCAGEQTFLLDAGNETAAVQTAMFGDHHIYNCLSAAASGWCWGSI
jgi:UDP-N-acetylmuramoyl-L-alanyl-D-glutamate--2,6-diaminopimelate ligase